MTLDAGARTMGKPSVLFTHRPKVFGKAFVDEFEENDFFVVGPGVVLWMGSIT